MNDLIGKRCRCIFNLPFHDWPFGGTPAWVIVEAVSMPMVKMRSKFYEGSIWINASTIQTISAVSDGHAGPAARVAQLFRRLRWRT